MDNAMNKASLFVFLIGCFAITACGASSTPITIVVSATPLLATGTPIPTNTPIPFPSRSSVWARNYLGAVESANVTMELVRVLVADIDGVNYLWQDAGGWATWSNPNDWAAEYWTNADGLIELTIKFTNNGKAPVEITLNDCGDSSVQVGGYQGRLYDIAYSEGAEYCDDILWDGASTITRLWVPLDNMRPNEVASLTLRVEPPEAQDGSKPIGPWFILEADLSSHQWEDVPKALQ
jgi:hypothetical protein